MLDTSAVLTGVARLPCDLEPPVKDDKVALVIWYKDGTKSPIYSLDLRGRSLQQATHWADEKTLGGRSFFRVSDEPDAGGTHLAVENVREGDAGSYRCRVDFKKSPTRNSIVNLTVIVPAQSVTILDEHGNPILRSEVGPYTEGATARLTCVASGGRPPPRVSWWRDDILVDDSDDMLDDDRVENELRLERLERRHLNTAYSCQASNNNVFGPVSSNVTIDMYLRPLEVRLLGENQPLSAGSQYEVACQSVGSRPPARISWWKGGQLMDRSRETTSSDGNVTTSTLTFIPRMEDLGTDLSCRANNTYMPGSARQDTWTLNIHYSPLVTLELGSNLNASSIREGVDVYFECIIRANPWIYKIIWRHNGRLLQNNASAGTILSNQTLVLQSVDRNSSGLYTCVASNSEGDSESNPFNLDVKCESPTRSPGQTPVQFERDSYQFVEYRNIKTSIVQNAIDEPICTAIQQRVYGAARLEEIQVICDVDANPPATLFRWLFNNSAVQTVEVGSVSSVPGGGRSIASYTPQSEQEYGTLLCWGRNELGAQLVPCVFHIVPAGKPDPPRNCKVLNHTSSSLQVTCSRGFDGGLPQEFTMELHATSVLGSSHRRLVSNVTSRSKPEFTVTGLEPGSSYIISVYSTNGKGRSLEKVSMKATTLKTTHQEHRKTATGSRAQPAFPHMAPVLWVLAGITGTLILVAIVVVVLLRTKGLRCDCCDVDEDERRSNGGSPGSDKGLTVAMQGQGLKSPGISSTALQTEDSGDNPDVIPHTNDIEYPSTVYKPLERNHIGTSTRMLNMDSPSQTVLYGNIQGFSRASTTESMLSYENQSVRWQQVTWRDIGVQAEPPGSPSASQPVLKVTPEQMAMLKQNAETQTPLLVRHKESAV